MNQKTPHNLANHSPPDPPFHFFLVPVALAEVIHQIVNAFRAPDLQAVWSIVLALAAAVAVFMIRIYSLKVQDRLIRLEERLRLAQILSESLKPRIHEL